MSAPIPCRYVVLSKIAEPCPECLGASAHSRCVWRYSLPDGTTVADLKPGDVYVNEAHESTAEAARAVGCPWDNCDGKHVFCMVPDGGGCHPWNIDGRASNCTLKDDRTHRCWVRHGDPVAGALHVDKSGQTCSAGAGSILVSGWHGFLHGGQLVSC